MSNGQIPAAQVADLAAAISAVVDALPEPTAADVSFTPDGDLSSTDVQAAIVEVRAAIDTLIAAAVDGLVDGAPGTLDTLNEIAAKLAEDDDALAALMSALGDKLDAADFLATLTAALVPGDNVTITPVGDTLVIDSTGGGGGPATTRWEVVLTGSPPEPVTNVDDTDWTYVEVPA